MASYQQFAAGQWSNCREFQRALTSTDGERLQLALALANQEYHHTECEKANSRIEQRSFCLHHEKITDTAVLAVHGWTGCPFEMLELGRKLHQQGLNVYGARLAGHGTCVEDFARYGQQDWEASAQKGLAITALLGRKVIVVGESMGGALTAILAADFGHWISKIVLCAPALWLADPKAEFSRFSLVRHLIPTVYFDEPIALQKGNWYTQVPISGVAELVKVVHKARRLGPKITAATVIIQATNDGMVRPAGARRFFKTLTGLQRKQKQLILVKDGHHNLTVDANPQKYRVFEWISDFCAGN